MTPPPTPRCSPRPSAPPRGRPAPWALLVALVALWALPAPLSAGAAPALPAAPVAPAPAPDPGPAGDGSAATNPATNPATLELRAQAGSRMYLDGRFAGFVDASGRASLGGLGAGEHRVMVTHPDRRPLQRHLTLAPGEHRTLDLSEAEPPAPVDYDYLEQPWGGRLGFDRLDLQAHMGWLLALVLLGSLLAVAGFTVLTQRLWGRDD